MATPPTTNVHMESMETPENASIQPNPMRHREVASLSVGQHKQGVLAHSQQLDTHPSNRR